ncbi:helicase HerA domain-containing protein [Halorussus salilacus]|uniref:helicase HerA domain-containing protein n=1 Tax=Halorussus salilacus TaxID=2953750 RepID=UPI0034A48444
MAVAEVSDGVGGDAGTPGETVDLPVVEVLTGRAFITGKSGSGKSNTASVVVEKLLDGGYPVMIVDVDGEYYGLKEEYELLHAGADDECDIQVEPQHAEKLASLALEDNVPIILDVSGYLNEQDGKDLLKAVAQQLFAKEKKLKKPFLLVVEEVHEYIPEGGGMDECGRMLIKIGKRGRKHGLGIAGISQRPADVKKDFITQCDWLVWHRLTWNNDTNVVGRILGSEYAEAIEEMDDGEAFLTTDWSEQTRRVQFHRKQTFDAGATPGLDDFERPDLKSVSDDLVGDLREISEAEAQREDRIEELEQELREKDSHIEDLERQLEEAREMEEVADKFAKAMLDTSRNRRANPYVGGGPGGRQADLGTYEGSDSAAAAAESDGGESGGDESDGDESGDAETDAARDPLDAIREELDALDPVERAMLAYYLREGPASPVDAHVVAGGPDDRELAYNHNRTLRRRGFVQHAGGGEYVASLPSLLAALTDGEMDDDDREKTLAQVAEELPDVE